jgi:two-component system sensor histidine kinase PilS (NtrC family)
MAVAALFLGITVFYGDALNLGSHQLGLFRGVCLAYLALAAMFHSLLRNLRDLFNVQLSAHLALDIVAITQLMYASGGIRSGLGVMLLIAIPSRFSQRQSGQTDTVDPQRGQSSEVISKTT